MTPTKHAVIWGSSCPGLVLQMVLSQKCRPAITVKKPLVRPLPNP